MSRIVRTIDADINETVRIRWHRRRPPAALYVNGVPYQIVEETLDEDHTAPPPETWTARMKPPEAE